LSHPLPFLSSLLAACALLVVATGCDPYPSGRGLDAVHPSSVRPRADPPPLPPISGATRQAQEALRADYQARIAALFPAAQTLGVSVQPARGTQVFGLYAVHPAFSDPTFSSGPVGLAVNDWIATHHDALVVARIREVGLAPSFPAPAGSFILFVR
jgi:hypothetical protein